MNAQDVMSSSVISIEPQTPVVQIAAILRQHKIGGLPVIQDNELVGIVTEKDLIHRWEIQTERTVDAHAWWRRMIGDRMEPYWYVKSHGRQASHVMTKPVIVASPHTSLREISGLFDAHRIGRVPVVAEDRVVGIVTCADLVQALASLRCTRDSAAEVEDEEIRCALMTELQGQSWWTGSFASVEVTDRTVCFRGFVENEAQRKASQVAAENIPGVQCVKDERQLTSHLPSMP